MKQILFVIACGTFILISFWSYTRSLLKDYSARGIAPGEIVEGTIDPGIPDVTGRKKGLIKFSSKSGMFKSDKDRREWLERWATDKQTKDVVFSSDPSTISRSVEEAFGTHRIIPTIGGAEDEAPFYPSSPIEYAYAAPSYPTEYWYGGGSRIVINDCNCDCVCCDCRPCGEEPVESIPYNPPTKPPLRPPITPLVIPPVEPPITPPDPPPPPKVPEGSTLWMLILGIAWIRRMQLRRKGVKRWAK